MTRMDDRSRFSQSAMRSAAQLLTVSRARHRLALGPMMYHQTTLRRMGWSRGSSIWVRSWMVKTTGVRVRAGGQKGGGVVEIGF